MSASIENGVSSDEELLSEDEQNHDLVKEKTPQLTAQERILLLELVSASKKVIECKKSDCGSIKSKQKAWTKIMTEFCCQPGTTRRSAKQLKKCWENLKRKSKKEVLN